MTQTSKPPPHGWPRMCASLATPDAAKAIDWLCRAFGFEVRLKVEGEGGRIEHSELVLAGAMIMLGDNAAAKGRSWYRPPAEVGGANTQALMLFVDDVDAHCARARAAGATIATEPKVSDYGEDYWTDRSYEAIDPDGHHWWFVQRLREQPAR